MYNIPLNLFNEQSMEITEDQLAKNVGSGDLEVFSTPMMISLMEKCCYLSIKPYLPDEYTSVGIHIEANHLYPLKTGDTIKISSVLRKCESKVAYFDVEAKHNDILIGTATHKRAIVQTEKFLQKLKNNN